MPATVVQRLGKGSAGAVASLSMTSGDGWLAPTSGNIIAVSANSDATVTIGGTGWSVGPSVVDGNGAYSWWKASNGTETTITVTPGVTARTCMTVHELSGVSLPADGSNSSTIAGSNGLTTTAAAVTTTASGDLILAYALLHSYAVSAPTSPSWSNSFVQAVATSSTPTAGSADVTTFVGELIAGAAGAYSTQCTWTSPVAGDRQHIIVAFKEAVAAAAVKGKIRSNTANAIHRASRI